MTADSEPGRLPPHITEEDVRLIAKLGAPVHMAQALRAAGAAILAEQLRVLELPDAQRVHHGEEARAWSNGMSNARRVVLDLAQRAEDAGRDA